MINVSVSVADNATGAVESLLSRNMARLQAAVGPAMVRLFRRNFLAKGTNKKGWPTTNFWSRAAKATTWAPIPNGVAIIVNQIGVRQRYFGGPINPVRARLLTIPLVAEAYGKTAREFTGLFFMQTKSGAKFLARREGGGQGQKARLTFLFSLREGVVQEADKSVIPSKQEMMAAVRSAFSAAMGNGGLN